MRARFPYPGAWARRSSRLLLLAMLVLATGCNTGVQSPEAARPLSAGKADPDYVFTVPLAPDDSIGGVERAYGGDVLVWQENDYAIVGVSALRAAQLRSGELSTLAKADELEDDDASFSAGGSTAYMNGISRIWSGGISRIWSGGTSRIWSGGDTGLWADGEYAWLPENTALWQQIQLEEGHRRAPNLGYGVKVAIIDTGVDLLHPALVEALAPAEEWWDFYGDDAVPQEEGVLGEGAFGHGTNVAGIVRQIAPRATILPIRVLGPDGDGDVADVAAAIVWAVDQGADVINLSLGGNGTSKVVEYAIQSAIEQGVLVVASTGNTGDTNVTYPAKKAPKDSHRLSVTSVDAQDERSSFATYGEDVELAAPGENVFGPAPGELAAAWSGTSMAAPMASGALALALAENPGVPVTDLPQALRRYSFNHYQGGLNNGLGDQLGSGRLDVALFLRQVMKR